MGKCSFPGHTLASKKVIYFQSDTGETRPKTECALQKRPMIGIVAAIYNDTVD
jgi:hypothetical protein